MTEIPYEVPKEWHDSLDELRERVQSLPEDPEDHRASAVGDIATTETEFCRGFTPPEELLPGDVFEQSSFYDE